MHEYSLASALIDQIETLRCVEQADRVVAVQVTIGEFSGVEPLLFDEAFKALVEGSPIAGAEMHWTTAPLRCECKDCGAHVTMERFRFECPDCKGANLDVTGGEGLILESVTLEQRESEVS